MKLTRIPINAGAACLFVTPLLRGGLNLPPLEPSRANQATKFRAGFSPANSCLTLPMIDFFNRSASGESRLEPPRCHAGPAARQAALAGHAAVLREQIIPSKIAYRGHRGGTAVCVQKDSNSLSMQDLRGERTAVPDRLSNQRPALRRAFTQPQIKSNRWSFTLV